MKTVCELNKCVGCGACLKVCPNNALKLHKEYYFVNAEIRAEKCIECNSCIKICQVNNQILFKDPKYVIQGWTNDEKRTISSSGGFAYEIMRSFLLNENSSVYSCTFEDGSFIYRKVENINDIANFVGSKYVKSDPQLVYDKIQYDLKNGYRVLFIGLPCHVQAVIRYCQKYIEKLYTVDLICHGTPSFELFYKYLKEENINTESIQSILFRNKTDFFLSINGRRLSSNKGFDYWLSPYLLGLTYTENCYNCRYARFSRCSDLTIGDSWGSEIDDNEKKKGISLGLIITDKGKELIDQSNIFFKVVDSISIRKANNQLNEPAHRPMQRDTLIDNNNSGASYKKTILKLYRMAIIKRYLLATRVGQLYLSFRWKYTDIKKH